jgi:hypothetical protein
MDMNPVRLFMRHTVDVPLEVKSGASSLSVSDKGVNVSYGGLAFTSAECLGNGDVVEIGIPTVTPPFHAHARVVWCRPEGDHFLVGVEFLEAADGFRARMVQQVCSIENYRRQVEATEGRVLTPQAAALEWIAKYAGQFPPGEMESAEPA